MKTQSLLKHPTLMISMNNLPQAMIFTETKFIQTQGTSMRFLPTKEVGKMQILIQEILLGSNTSNFDSKTMPIIWITIIDFLLTK